METDVKVHDGLGCIIFPGGGLSWAAFPLFQDILGVQGNAAFEKIRSTYLGQILGIPAFVLIVIFARRIVTLGEARMLVPIAALGLAVNGAAGYSLFLNFGVIGLGYAYSMSNYATALAMVWMERRIKFET